MEYYQLKPTRNIPNQIKPIVEKKEIWKEEPVFLAGKVDNPKEYIYFPPIIQEPIWMISNAVKEIIERYQSKQTYYPVALGSIGQTRVEPYWIWKPIQWDCIDETTEYKKDGCFLTLSLTQKKIGFQKVFQVEKKMGKALIIELEVLEQLLKKRIVGYEIIPVKVVA